MTPTILSFHWVNFFGHKTLGFRVSENGHGRFVVEREIHKEQWGEGETAWINEYDDSFRSLSRALSKMGKAIERNKYETQAIEASEARTLVMEVRL